MRLRSGILICILMTSLLILGAGCAGTPIIEDDKQPIQVKAITLENEVREKVLSYVGHIRAEKMVKLSFGSGGKIEEIPIKEGETISQGQVLAAIAGETIEADIDGVVVSILAQEEEIVGPGIPVIVIRTIESIMVVGIAQNEIEDIRIGLSAEVNINDKIIEGEITRIDETPDDASRTYNIDIELEEDGYRIGTIGKVSIPVGETEGIWIPITSVLTNGDDFVYIIENKRALRKIIEPVDYIEGDIRIEGLNEGDVLVVEGIGQLKDNDPVEIVP